ncbi:MAG TPA: sensor histidine kinase [Polyangia bacterium]|nr:sensor histidine kinase [Polyangia bacterium]
MRVRAWAAFVAVQLASASALAAPPARAIAGDTGPLLLETKLVAGAFAVLAVLLAVLLYTLPARAVAATKRQLESVMGERALTLQEEDRRRIARELHDGAGQALTAARLQLIALREGAPEQREAIAGIVTFVDEAIDEVRRSTTALAPPALAELGLIGAIRRHCETFAAAARLKVHCELPETLPALPAYVETTIYRSMQEALHNAARHGGAKQAWVRLAVVDKQLRLEIGDDGAGFADQAKRGHGIGSMRERAHIAGGALTVVDDAGPGARIRISLPFGEAES